MTTVNPYAAPTADDIGADVAAYEPKVFSFTGRIGRLRYLAYSLVWGLLITVIGSIMMAVVGGAAGLVAMFLVLGLIYIGGVVSMFTLAVRRLNDLGQRGWWSLLLLVPFANLALAVYMLFWPGSAGNNQFGPQPVANSPAVIAGAALLPIMMIIGVVAAVMTGTGMSMDTESGFEFSIE